MINLLDIASQNNVKVNGANYIIVGVPPDQNKFNMKDNNSFLKSCKLKFRNFVILIIISYPFKTNPSVTSFIKTGLLKVFYMKCFI